MKWEDIERKLAQEMGSQEHPVDTDALWAAVKDHIPQEEKKDRGIIFWLWGIGLLFTLSSVSYGAYRWYQSEDQDIDLVETSTLSSAIKATAILTDEAINQAPAKLVNTSLSESSIDNIRSTERSIASSQANEGSKPSKQSSKSLIANNNTLNNYTYNDNTPTKPIDLAIGQSKNSVAPFIEYDAELRNRTSASVANSMKTKKFWISESITALTIDPLLWETEDYNAPQNSILPTPKYKGHWSIEGGLGLLAGHDHLSLRNQEWADHYTRRELAEEALPSYNLHLMGTYHFAPAWSVRAGLRYQHRYKRSNGSIQYLEDIELQDALLKQVYSMDGVQNITGSATVQQVISENNQRINQYRRLEIPAELQYALHSGKWSWETSVGGAIGIYSDISGFTHPFADREYDLSTDTEGWYLARIPTLSIGVSSGAAYQLESIDIYSRIRYQYDVNSITNKEYGVAERLSGWNIEIGLRKHF